MSTEEKRAPDQDAAIEAAFVAGTLPEEDRRRDEALAAVVAENAALKEELTALRADVVTVSAAHEANSPLVDAAWNYLGIRTAEDVSELQGKLQDLYAIPAVLNMSGVGSIFEKTSIGWNVKYVDGGTTITVQGPTIPDALASHGAQVEHPKPRKAT